MAVARLGGSSISGLRGMVEFPFFGSLGDGVWWVVVFLRGFGRFGVDTQAVCLWLRWDVLFGVKLGFEKLS